MKTQTAPDGIIELEKTHWHKLDINQWDQLIAAIPKVIDSNLKLWQLRIDRQRDHLETPFTDHKNVFIIEASRYTKREDGVHASNGEQFSFLVCAGNSRIATDKVKAQLNAHGFNSEEWSMSINSSPLILA